MRTPTPEQQAILDSQDRVRVVRAVPGSGKTWLVAELIRQELDKWPTKTSGIAALSFTRVGGEEIRKAVGHELGHPHFVGTIDAFLFRYIVRPFFQRCFPNFASPRLIPGEWGAENWSNYEPYIKIGDSPSSNPFRCIFINEEVNGQALVAYKPYSGRLQQLDNQAAGEVKKVKRQIWEGSGRLTHSDVAYCASKILDHKILGVVARTELIRRFPLIIVDELQDTGYFHGKSILLVLEESIARGMLVGDPDQAIYLFNGARPDLFNRFELLTSVKSFPLPESRRCSSSVATVASHLKDSGGNIRTADSNNGRAFLIRSDSMVEDIPRVFDTVKKVKHPTSVKVKIIARRKIHRA